jgi:hypothetical protein
MRKGWKELKEGRTASVSDVPDVNLLVMTTASDFSAIWRPGDVPDV